MAIAGPPTPEVCQTCGRFGFGTGRHGSPQGQKPARPATITLNFVNAEIDAVARALGRLHGARWSLWTSRQRPKR